MASITPQFKRLRINDKGDDSSLNASASASASNGTATPRVTEESTLPSTGATKRSISQREVETTPADLYHQGHYLLDWDKEKARENFKSAADRGHATAQYELAAMDYWRESSCDSIDNSQEDIDQIFYYMSLAAEQGLVDAHEFLGDLYHNGELPSHHNEHEESVITKMFYHYRKRYIDAKKLAPWPRNGRIGGIDGGFKRLKPTEEVFQNTIDANHMRERLIDYHHFQADNDFRSDDEAVEKITNLCAEVKPEYRDEYINPETHSTNPIIYIISGLCQYELDELTPENARFYILQKMIEYKDSHPKTADLFPVIMQYMPIQHKDRFQDYLYSRNPDLQKRVAKSIIEDDEPTLLPNCIHPHIEQIEYELIKQSTIFDQAKATFDEDHTDFDLQNCTDKSQIEQYLQALDALMDLLKNCQESIHSWKNSSDLILEPKLKERQAYLAELLEQSIGMYDAEKHSAKKIKAGLS